MDKQGNVGVVVVGSVDDDRHGAKATTVLEAKRKRAAVNIRLAG